MPADSRVPWTPWGQVVVSGVDATSAGEGITRIRSDKARITANVSRLASEHGIRLLAAGGPVFVAQGLISPWVSRFVAVIVDPARFHDFVRIALESGWTLVPPKKGSTLLPSVTVSLSRNDWAVDLRVYSTFPGFYAPPQNVFDLLWNRRQTMLVHGIQVRTVDRLVTIMLAVHDRLGDQPRSPRAQSNKSYLLAQFHSGLTEGDRSRLRALTEELGAGEPMRQLFVALDMDPGGVVLPPESYAKWRLGLPTVGPALIALLALVECPPKSRMIQTLCVLRQSPGTVFRAVIGFPRAIWLLAGVRRRLWKDILVDQGLSEPELRR
ncbi:MAG: hypothetical protein QOD27_1199 [Microbacteriaceae bacterium]|nr:hypothetical protein [Microbacteriaceae bacterium]